MTGFPGTQVVIDTDGDTFLTGNLPMGREISDDEKAFTAAHSGSSSYKWGGHWFYYIPLGDGDLTWDFSINSAGNVGAMEFYAGSTMDDLEGAGLAGAHGPFAVEGGHTYYFYVVADSATAVASGIFTGAATNYYGPTVILDPWDRTVNEGDEFSFRSLGAGRPTPTRQWQKHEPGSPDEVPGETTLWNAIAGETGEYLTFTATLDDDGWMYRAVYTSAQGVKASAAATLTIGDPDIGDGELTDWDDASDPDAEVSDESASGSSTLLELVRQFSIDTRQAVRIIDDHNIEVVNLSDPLPTGIAQADAGSMYHSVTRTSQAGERTLSLEEEDLVLTASAEITEDDVRIIESDWQIPNALPVQGLSPAVVSRVSYNFTPTGFTGSLEFAYPRPLTIVRRSS